MELNENADDGQSAKRLKRISFSRQRMLAFGLTFAVIGGWVLYRSFASAPVIATLQAEQMTLPPGSSVINDSAAGGGQAVQLLSSGSLNGSVDLPSNNESLIVRAKGVKCKGVWPQLSLKVDDTTTWSGRVSSTGWSDYSISKALNAGNHSISLSFSSEQRGNCSTKLYVDMLTFYGPVPPPIPSPTVSLSATPTSLTAGEASTLTWNSASADYCTASGGWNGTQPTTGSTSTGALNFNSTYTLTCTGPGGSASAIASVTVTSATPPVGGCLTLLTTAPAGYCSGKTYYVSASSGQDTNAGTQSAPFKTIEKAASLVVGGDVVLVGDGTYTDTNGDKNIVNLTRGGSSSNWVVFKSINKGGAKLDGQNNTAYNGFVFKNNIGFVRIEGFDIAGVGNIGNPTGSASGIEIYNGGHDSQIVGNNIHDIGKLCVNSSNTNGEVGVFLQQPNVTLENNLIHDIGRYANGENGCSQSNTYYQTHDHGIYVNGSTPGGGGAMIRNNIFYNIKKGWAIQLYPGSLSNVNILNNTFAFGNPYKAYSFIVVGATFSGSNIKNNIFYDPSGGKTIENVGSSGSLTISNNITTGSSIIDSTAGVTLSSNRLSTHPQLVNPPADFRLQSTSPAINAGATISTITIDYTGSARPQGGSYDVGAYEQQ